MVDRKLVIVGMSGLLLAMAPGALAQTGVDGRPGARCFKEARDAGIIDPHMANPGKIRFVGGTDGHDTVALVDEGTFFCGFDGRDHVETNDGFVYGGDSRIWDSSITINNGTLFGGEGSNYVELNYGVFHGNRGHDLVGTNHGDFYGAGDADWVDINGGSGDFFGGDGRDRIEERNYGLFRGGAGDDFVHENWGTFFGEADNDEVLLNVSDFYGGEGSDSVKFNLGSVTDVEDVECDDLLCLP